MGQFWAGFNESIATSCDCLGLLDEDLVDYTDPTVAPTCNTPDSANITCTQDESVCEQIASFCGATLLFIVPDLDTDGDAVNDSMSVGMTLEAVPAQILGVQ